MMARIGTLIFLALISNIAFGQAGSVTATAFKSKVTDSTTVSIPSGWGGIYYLNQSNKWKIVQNGTTYDLNKFSTGSGSSTFAGLTDGPGSLSGHALNYMRVNSGATALEYRTISQALSDMSGVSTSRTLTINGTTLDLSANRTWTVGDALVANPLSQFAATTSAQLRSVLSDESGNAEALFGGATPSAFTLTNATGLPISTGLTGGGSNRIPYFTSTTALATSAAFLFDGTNLGIGATPQSILTVSKQTTIGTPVSGSLASFIGLDANPLRLDFQTHNNSNASGTAFMLVRSRGTAGTPLAVSSGDDLGSFNVRGYGATGYAASSTGLFSFKANQNFNDTNMGTYASIYTTPDNSVTAAEAFRFGGSGQLGIGGATYGTSGNVFQSGGSSAAPTWAAITLSNANSVTGTLGVGNGGTGITSLGSGVATWLGTPSWTNFNSAITGTAPYWALTGTSTATGAITISGTSTNTIKYQFNSLGTTQTDGAGLWLQNSTASTNGNQQDSPLLTFEAQGFATTPVASQTIKVALDVLPVQGSANPTGTFRMRQSVNGGSYADVFSISSIGGSATWNFTAGGSAFLNAGAFIFSESGTEKMRLSSVGYLAIGSTSNNAQLYVAQANLSSNWVPAFRVDPGTHITQSASTEYINYDLEGATQTAASGTTTTQRNAYIRRITYAGTSGTRTITNPYGLYVEDAAAGTNATLTNNYALGLDGNLKLVTAKNKIFITEGTDGSVGQTTLVSGTKAITINGTTTSSRCIATLVSQGGTVTTTVAYGCVCTANTVTITALTSAGATDTSDTSILNYWIVN